MTSNTDEFVYGSKLLRNEFDIEDRIEQMTDALLAQGQLGKRAPQIYRELGSTLSFFLQAASCQWGCRGGDHIEENLIRRLANYTFAALRLARLGLYNESLAQLRSVAELANLVELFTVDRSQLNKWVKTPAIDRWKDFKPGKVHQKIVNTGNKPIVDRPVYSKLCDLGPHVSPESVNFSHQSEGTVYASGEFSPFAFLVVLNELAIILSACLKLIGHLVEAPQEKIGLLTKAGEKLEQAATSWLRITNYEERMHKVSHEKQTI